MSKNIVLYWPVCCTGPKFWKWAQIELQELEWEHKLQKQSNKATYFSLYRSFFTKLSLSCLYTDNVHIAIRETWITFELRKNSDVWSNKDNNKRKTKDNFENTINNFR